MSKVWSGFKRVIRRTLLRAIPAEVRRRLVARFPSLPLAPHSRGEAGAQFDGSTWERFYAKADPYKLATSEYENEKYERTLDCIGDGPFDRALEVGCSVGIFTQMLAPRCKYLLGVDISGNAVKQARERTADLPQVKCERRVLPKEMPEGPFDLIVCSDTLYYWPQAVLEEAMRAFEVNLSPGGRFVALHYTGAVEPGAALDGNRVHDILKSDLNLENTFSKEYEKYRVDRFEKSS